MIEVNRCFECGVPEPFMQGQVWLNNGDIVQRANQNARVGFVECENFDPLFQNIGDIIGFPIERIVVNLSNRAHRIYLETLFPEEARRMVIDGTVDSHALRDPVITFCQICGFGKYEYVADRYEKDDKDFYTQRITRPYSVPLAAGALAGAMGAILGGEHDVTWTEVSPDCYEFTSRWGKGDQALAERFRLARYEHRDGDLELQRCASCGMPKAFNAYEWDLENGLIRNRYTGRRMALVGPESLEQIFQELEFELGETIPNVVIEAQRRFTKTGFYSIDKISDEGNFRTQLALRGLGNLRNMVIRKTGLSLKIENPAAYLMTTGMVQGLFEMIFDIDSKVEWEIGQEGELLVEVVPA
jgi:hypothetical protein